MLENRETEFKRENNDKVNKDLLAFINTDGGILYIGINDDGTVCGISNPDDVMLAITNSFRDSVAPDPTVYFKAEPIEKDGKVIIKITVERGEVLPFCFKEYGLVPKGVYVRASSNSVQATREHIRQLIRESSGDVFVDSISIDQNLTFDYAEKLFKERDIAFGDSQKRTLGVIGTDGRYTNLGLIISDQCPYAIKVAIFQGNTKKLFKDRKEFGGSVFKQIDDCLAYLNVYNKISSVFKGLYRVDRTDYPEVAIREALINATIHRDYYIEGAILVSLFDNRLEIMSIGGLMPGVTQELMRHGVSIPRNEALAKTFHRLKLIEAYGTGLPRIFETYNEFGLSPEFPVTQGGVIISMPNINNTLGELSESDKSKTTNGAVQSKKITVAESSVLKKYAGKTFTKDDVASDFELGQSGAYKLLRRMAEKGLLSVERQGKEFVYSAKV
ncbi:MAG: putative DNA binding domain-containing protein [Firmicutes bacterium]|nr:putative DNA binding domain-containing protein [Bacillota bacterium]